jgi:hypothetical protein
MGKEEGRTEKTEMKGIANIGDFIDNIDACVKTQS